MEDDIVAKLKASNLLGRSGSAFPTGLKWEMVKNEQASKKYIVCNAASGEPKVMKDEYLLQNHPEEIIEGIKIALRTIDNSSAYIYLRKDFKEEEKLSAQGFFDSIGVFAFDGGCGEISAKMLASLDKQGLTINQNDCLIASIILKNGFNKILTRNKKHFERIKNLKVLGY